MLKRSVLLAIVCSSPVMAQQSVILPGNTQFPAEPPLSVVDLQSAPPANGAYISGTGAAFSIAPVGGHQSGDTQRAQEYLKLTTQATFTQQENALFIDSVNNQGAVNSWKASTSYPAGSYVHSADNQYTYHTVAGGMSGTSGGPTCTSGTCMVDGGITWTFVTAGINDGKVGIGQSIVMNPGAGHQWGQATAMVINNGAFPPVAGGFAVLYEMDLNQSSGRDCPPGVAGGCQVYGEYLSGQASPNKGTVGIFAAGAGAAQPMYHWGLYMAPGFASDVGIIESSGATVGTQESGTNATASVQNSAVAPIASQYTGTYSAAVIDSSAATASYFARLKQGQNLCFNGTEGCMSEAGGTWSLSMNFGSGISLDTNNNFSVLSGRTTLAQPLQSKTYVFATPTSGSTVTIADTQDTAIIKPAGSLAALTVKLPTCSATYDGKGARFSSTQAVTALTVTATAGTVVGSTTGLAAGVGPSYICRGADTSWYRLQ